MPPQAQTPSVGRQFPELMQGKKIMYVHGFGSSAATGTVALLRRAFPGATVVAEDIPLDPEAGLAMLQDQATREQPDLILGTSMGGMYAEMLVGFDRILVNPAFKMADTMREHGFMGRQPFFYPRKDGVQDFVVTKALVKAYQAVTERCFAQVTPEEQGRVFGLFGDRDPLVQTWDLFLAHYPQAIRFHGEHQLDEHAFYHAVVPLIRRIDDQQEGRMRPVIVISLDCLQHRHSGEAAEGARKAFRHLLDHYRLLIAAPASFAAPDRLAPTLDWVFRHFDAPAWDQVLFTNQRELLAADYLVAREETPGFMGAHICFGADALKNWEEITVFFDRLGGQ